MAEAFLQLPETDRVDVLGVAAEGAGRPAYLLEKDVWVVWALDTMFSEPFGEHLVFKGGTSLSKAYGAIQRFSEDVDLTYDIRQLIPDSIGTLDPPLPASKSQEKKWTRLIRERLPAWIADKALGAITRRIQSERVPASARVDPSDGNVIRIEYTCVSQGTGYVQPVVVLEFGAHSTGEPSDVRTVVCDAATHVKTVTFPTASPRVMRVERTFWEKATAIHVMCSGGKVRGGAERYSRHWYDLVQLDQSGHVASAIRDRDLARQVAEHKRWFFEEKNSAGELIDYHTAIQGGLRLTPEGQTLTALRDDYEKMVAGGLLHHAPQPFEELLESCRQIQERANTLAALKP